MEASGETNRPQRRERARQSGGASRRRPLVAEKGEAAMRRARRLARRRRLAERRQSVSKTPASESERGTAEVSSADRPVALTHVAGRDLRFFLSRSSDIEAAPSIGPKTAESLRQLGVLTVNDLLQIRPEKLAQQLNRRRITADVIELWQSQSRLMCQVPELRGHDVQLLVACGVTDPEDLASRRPNDLLALIVPFAESKEGARIIRSGPKPDLNEIREWIRWAASARSFRAAS